MIDSFPLAKPIGNSQESNFIEFENLKIAEVIELISGRTMDY
jgi:hypothetical protein